MASIVALIGRPHRRPTIEAQLRAVGTVRVAERSDEVRPLVTSVRARLVVAELRDRTGRSAVPMLAQLAAREDAPGLIALASLSEADATHVFELAASRVPARIVLTDVDDLALAVRLALDGQPDTRVVLPLLGRIGSLVPTPLAGFFVLCGAHASPELKVGRAAKLLHLGKRTIESRLARAGLPPARRVMAWCAALRACWRLDVLDERPKQAAVRVGFSSHAALANALARYCGCTPTTVRAHGGFAAMLERFVAELDRRPP